MSDCTHDCSSCGENFAERQGESPFQIKPLREGCRVGKVYGVVSGKGGVGKSMVTSQLAVTMQRRGHNVAVLDADITGPSIPKAFGIHGRAAATQDAILPLSIFQSIPLGGIIIVASPQELVSMVVQKAVKMAQMMNIPIVGLVENMSYITCPDCGKKLYPFGEGKTQQAADEYGLPLLARMPIDPELAQLVDQGRIEDFQGSWLDAVADKL